MIRHHRVRGPGHPLHQVAHLRVVGAPDRPDVPEARALPSKSRSYWFCRLKILKVSGTHGGTDLELARAGNLELAEPNLELASLITLLFRLRPNSKS